ncbi:guanine nucleotide-binding protein alpha-2 subunit isoform X1 [Senna tora]|uniref:Guanine nucleotide-binding protein alpha subunit n=1 Tax=Senna tora TaxID=362788 RepID=A0A834WQ17_9FABA|nr:guanine nucleotide-binding protein alpha-2 subunit isoform X1 [Senna tora]
MVQIFTEEISVAVVASNQAHWSTDALEKSIRTQFDFWWSLTGGYSMLSFITENMGLLCSRNRRHNNADAEENTQAAEIERRIELETKAEKHIQKLLLLGTDIKLLFQTGFDEAELKSYAPVIHANVYQTIKILYDGSKELTQNDPDSSKYVISDGKKDIGEKLSEIGGRLDYPCLTTELAQEIETLWKDAAIQETYARGNELQVPDCASYFMENLRRLSDANYVPTKEDVLYARVRTTGVVEIQFSPVGENKKSGEVYRLFDVGGQRNERRKWIHLFEGVTAVIFCAAISEYAIVGCSEGVAQENKGHQNSNPVLDWHFGGVVEETGKLRCTFVCSQITILNTRKTMYGYDQTLFEDENKNRMMETKELFEWVLKQPCFEKTSFMLFLNKFDIFEKKIHKVPLTVCEWFKDYQSDSTGKEEIENAYEFVKKKFEEIYFQSTAPDRVDRVFKIYRTTALDQKVVKKTFKLVDETLRRRNLFEAGLL